MPDPTPNGTKNFLTSRSDWATWLPVVALIVSTSGGGAQSPEEVTATLQEGAGLIESLWAWILGAVAIALKTWSNIKPSGKRVVLGVGTPAILIGLLGLGTSLFVFTTPVIASTGLAATMGGHWIEWVALAVLAVMFVRFARRPSVTTTRPRLGGAS